MAVSILSPVKTHIFIPACASLSMHSGTWQGKKRRDSLQSIFGESDENCFCSCDSNERGKFIIGNLIPILSERTKSLTNCFQQANNTSIMFQDTQS